MILIRHAKTGEVLLQIDADTLSGYSLAGADLRGANLAEADLSAANIVRARYDEDTRWPPDYDPRGRGATRLGWVLPGPAVEPVRVDAALAREIAIQAVAVNDSPRDLDIQEPQCVGDTWRVTTWDVMGYDQDGTPQSCPGGDKHITVDAAGRVVQYIKGF